MTGKRLTITFTGHGIVEAIVTTWVSVEKLDRCVPGGRMWRIDDPDTKYTITAVEQAEETRNGNRSDDN